jgi:anion-transporting  ArsA/GET3 family ATPase
MLQAVAKSLNLAVEDLQSKLASGQTLVQIAEAQRVKAEDLPALLEKARSDALEAAVADGALTQAQADWMAEHPGMLRMLALGQMRGWWDDGARGPRRGFGQRW